VPPSPGSTFTEGRYFSLWNVNSGTMSASLEWSLPPEILRPGEVVLIVLRARLVESRTAFFWSGGINARIHPGGGWLVEESKWPKVDRSLPAGTVREQRGTTRMPEAGGGDLSLDVFAQGELACTWSYRYAWVAGDVPVAGPAAPKPPAPPPVSATSWKSAGTGDCPGSDVANSTGPNPDPSKCTTQFAGFTAVCWSGGCTYKNLATGSCTGGANPGRMYTCSVAAAPAAPPAFATSWKSAGTGDCPGSDVANSTGPNPDPSKCTT